MSPGAFLNYAINTVVFSTPALLLAYTLPRRQHFHVRLLACFLVLFTYLRNPFAGLLVGSSTSLTFAVMSVFFGLIVVLLAAGVFFCFDVPLHVATFCAVMGYTVQNLGSSLGELVGLLVRRAGITVPVLAMPFPRACLCAIVTFAAFYLVVVRRFKRNGIEVNASKSSFALVFGVVLLNIIFDMAVKYLRAYSLPPSFPLLFRVVQLVVCFYALMLEYEILYNHRLLTERDTTARMIRQREEQYDLARENIEMINIKCHDIRHQIRKLESGAASVDRGALADLARQVNIYDSKVKTGNDALDTILTEKSLLCEQEHITLGCIADGAALSFMSPTDLYSLFGNAIDNAFEAVRRVPDEEKRSVSLLVRRNAGMVSIHVENYFEGKVRFHDGLPVTTKADKANHGWGVKSMRMIAERYGGSLVMGTEGETFYLNMLIPIPEDAAA